MHFRSVRAVFTTALLIFLIINPIFGKTIIINGNKHLTEQFIKSLTDSSDIYGSLMQSGYFDDISVKPMGDTVLINVKEFPYIKNITINGNLIFPSIINKFSRFKNSVLNKKALKDTLLTIIDFYNYNGYPEASFDTISVNDSILHIHLYQGEIDSIRFFNTSGSEKYIRKLLNLKEGDIIDNYTIQSTISNLLHSGYFYDARYFIKRKERYYLDFYLLDAFPFYDTSSVYLSSKSIITNETGNILSLTRKFDDLHYSIQNNIYLKRHFSIDKWIFSVSAMYSRFKSKFYFGANGFFNHSYSTYTLNSGYKNKNILLGIGAGYDFVKKSPTFMANIKVYYHNINYMSLYYRYLNSYFILNKIKFGYSLNRSLSYGLAGECNYSQLSIPYPIPFEGFYYNIQNFSYLAGFYIIYKNKNGSVNYKFGYFDHNLYQTIEVGYSSFSVSLSTRLTSGLEHHLSFQYSSYIPF